MIKRRHFWSQFDFDKKLHGNYTDFVLGFSLNWANVGTFNQNITQILYWMLALFEQKSALFIQIWQYCQYFYKKFHWILAPSSRINHNLWSKIDNIASVFTRDGALNVPVSITAYRNLLKAGIFVQNRPSKQSFCIFNINITYIYHGIQPWEHSIIC